MMKRMILMLLVVAAFVGALGAFKAHQVKAAMAMGKAYKPPPEAVTTTVARQEAWSATVKAIGTVTAVQGVTVSADQPGIVEKILFDSGRAVKAGDVLVHLDTRQEEAQLAAAESARDLSRINLDRMKGLKESGIIALADYDKAAAELTQGDAKVGEIRATIERKTIRAPFSGVLGIRQVNLGQYLASGAPIVSLQTLQPIYVDFSVPQQQVASLHAGTAIQLTAEGRETRAGSPPSTQSSIRRRATSRSGPRSPTPTTGSIRACTSSPGSCSAPARPASPYRSPRSDYAPYGDSVFVVEDVEGPDGKPYLGVRQQFVKLGRHARRPGGGPLRPQGWRQVVTSGVFKLRPAPPCR